MTKEDFYVPEELSLTKENLACKDKDTIVAVVHDGVMHADDVFAIALLMCVYNSNNVKVIRSRSANEANSSDIVLDVGRIYDGQKFFDHHQSEDEDPKIVAKNGVKHCAFTLLAEKVISDKEMLEKFQEKVGYPIAVRDNGQIEMFDKYSSSVGSWVKCMNPTWEEENVEDIMFRQCCIMARTIIIRELMQIKATISAREVVKKTIEKSKDHQVIVFSKYIPYEEVTDEYPDVLFVIFRVPEKDQWILQSVPKNSKNKFDSRMLLPKQWRGYDPSADYFDSKYHDFIKDVGAHCVFVHKAGFISSWFSKDAAIQAAQIAVKAANYT